MAKWWVVVAGGPGGRVGVGVGVGVGVVGGGWGPLSWPTMDHGNAWLEHRNTLAFTIGTFHRTTTRSTIFFTGLGRL